jgi:hypothetical protein
MGEKRRRSKKRSSSNNQRPLKGFTLYLCNCIDYPSVAETLHRHGFRFQRHRDHFPPDVEDVVLLKKVGLRKWILITGDKRQRIKPLEKAAIRQYKVRQFVIADAAIGDIGELIVRARRRMRNLCKRNTGPFIFAINPSGTISPRPLDGVTPDLNSN